MPQFNDNIRRLATQNTDFRREILTNQHSQLVLMSIEPGDEIGEETHDVDQLLAFVGGEGEAVLDGKKSRVEEGSLVAVPAGTRHKGRGARRRAPLAVVVPDPFAAADCIMRTEGDET
jgi:mannose-6-phosphate isomerase-like protein (cupin superfamily)